MSSFSGTWTPQDRAESVWHYLPVDVPAGCPGLRITLDYDRSHGAAGVIDLGLVDPQGWRGWSGGAREVVEVGLDASTPGYLARGVPAGGWEVVLGLHRLPAGGLGYRVEVEFEPVAPPSPVAVPVAERPPRRVLPAADGLRWLAGDCHTHTVHSDGSLSVEALAALAAARGLDFVWVTDHNTVSHHEHLGAAGARHGVDLLPGQEVTSADGHANALGDIGWIDFREPARTWLAETEHRGGLLSVNHPVAGDCAWRHPMDSPPPLAEVWHEAWADRADGGPLAWWLAAGSPTPIGGSDWHGPGPGAAPGTPTTWVACADGDVLGGLSAGRTAVSAGPDAPVLLHVGDEWVAVEADGTNLVCPDGRRTPVRGGLARFGGHDGAHLLERTDRGIVSIAA